MPCCLLRLSLCSNLLRRQEEKVESLANRRPWQDEILRYDLDALMP